MYDNSSQIRLNNKIIHLKNIFILCENPMVKPTSPILRFCHLWVKPLVGSSILKAIIVLVVTACCCNFFKR